MSKGSIAEKARILRASGMSLREISETLGISKSTASLWVRNQQLGKEARLRISSLSEAGRRKSALYRTNQRDRAYQVATEYAHKDMKRLRLESPVMARLICALLYVCEGGKTDRDGVRFMNSDPDVVRTFLRSFRIGFLPKEDRFRVCVHLHEYHDQEVQMAYWSTVTNIPLQQFIKPHLKSNTGQYKKIGYAGCASIRYQDVNVVRRILALARAATSRIR